MWGIILNSFVFAQSDDIPEICNVPSEQFTQYTNFANEILGALRKYEVKEITEDNVEEYSAARRFWKSNTQDIIRWSKSLALQGIIVTQIATQIPQDIFGGFNSLFKNSTFNRDWQVLLDLDSAIHNLVYDLGINSKLYKQLDEEVLSEVKEITKKYQSENEWDNIFEAVNIESITTYSNLISNMKKLNRIFKLYFSSPWELDWWFVGEIEEYYDEWEIYNWGAYMQLDLDFISEFEKAYEAATGIENWCNQDFRDLWKNIEQVAKGGVWSAKDAWWIIKNSVEEFKAALSNSVTTVKNKTVTGWEWWVVLSEYQQQLLRNVYGIVPDLSNNNLLNTYVDITVVSNKNNNRAKLWNINWNTNVLSDEISSEFNSFGNIVNDVFAMHDSEIYSFEKYDNTMVNAKFKEIFDRIKDLRNLISNDVNTELSEACNYQCSNKWNDGCV